LSERLTLAHSADAHGAFVYYALATGRIDTGDLDLECERENIEGLNLRALNGEAEVSTISIYAYAKVSDDYLLLPHGFAIGERYGPRVVARESLGPGDLRGRVVAAPGQFTSAHLALRLFEPEVDVRFVRSDEVMDYVCDGFADAGVIIDDGQLGLREAGLSLVLDLGEWWYERTGLPLPLAGNVSRHSLGDETIGRVCRYVRQSIEYALDHRSEALAYVAESAGDVPVEQLDRFLEMYVNRRTLDIGDDGREVVLEFLERGYRARFLDRLPQVEFFEY
jgi:1,4-dihydroxy-6-naphthoate synthase